VNDFLTTVVSGKKWEKHSEWWCKRGILGVLRCGVNWIMWNTNLLNERSAIRSVPCRDCRLYTVCNRDLRKQVPRGRWVDIIIGLSMFELSILGLRRWSHRRWYWLLSQWQLNISLRLMCWLNFNYLVAVTLGALCLVSVFIHDVDHPFKLLEARTALKASLSHSVGRGLLDWHLWVVFVLSFIVKFWFFSRLLSI